MDDAINMVNEHHKKNTSLTRCEVRNETGEVIGKVTFDEGIKKHNYTMGDRLRRSAYGIAMMTAIVASVVAGKAVDARVKANKELLANAQAYSVNQALEVLNTESFADDNDVIDAYMGKVKGKGEEVAPDAVGEIYNNGLKNRLIELYKKMDILSQNDPKVVDKAALLEQYKKEYEAIVRTLADNGVYFNLDGSIEEVKKGL